MPAMPMFNQNGEPIHSSWSRLGDGSLSGLTKREMFAMNADIGGVEFDSILGLSRFLGREINEHDDADLIKAGLELKAKLKVMAADALLVELEK